MHDMERQGKVLIAAEKGGRNLLHVRIMDALFAAKDSNFKAEAANGLILAFSLLDFVNFYFIHGRSLSAAGDTHWLLWMVAVFGAVGLMENIFTRRAIRDIEEIAEEVDREHGDSDE